jgi:tripartite-type tricarboxylate transporter receptor subunit TctC
LNVPQVNKRGTWFGAFAPKGTPPDVVNKLALEFEKALKDPDVIERMRPITITSAYLGPKDLKKIWDEDYKAYGEIIKSSGIKAE